MIAEKLYDWQRRIVDSITKPKYGLFLDCGCGKTPVSLAIAEKRNCDKVLIITINSKAEESILTPGSWYQWASKMGDGDMAVFGKGKTPEFTGKDVLVVNYESLYIREKKNPNDKRLPPIKLKTPLPSFIQSCAGKNVCVICDESHRLKDKSTNISRSVDTIITKLSLTANSTSVLMLSGTPFTTGYIDLWNQLRLIGFPMSKNEFKDRFCVMGQYKRLAGWQQPIVGYKNLDELHKIIHEYAITIKSEEVMNLPEQFFVEHPLPPNEFFSILTKPFLRQKELVSHNGRLAKLHQPVIDITTAPKRSVGLYYNPWYRNIDYPEEEFVCDTPALLWMRARQLSIGFQGNSEKYFWYDRSRLEKFEEFMSDFPDNYVVFYNYVPEFNELFWICERLGYKIDVYNGDIKNLTFYEKYESQSEQERAANTKNIILANFASGSTGKNWQAYSKCVLFSLPLYKDWEQGLKRVHRNGSKDPVTYHIFSSDNWLDKDMRDALDHEIQYSQEMFNKSLNTIALNFEKE